MSKALDPRPEIESSHCNVCTQEEEREQRLECYPVLGPHPKMSSRLVAALVGDSRAIAIAPAGYLEALRPVRRHRHDFPNPARCQTKVPDVAKHNAAVSNSCEAVKGSP